MTSNDKTIRKKNCDLCFVQDIFCLIWPVYLPDRISTTNPCTGYGYPWSVKLYAWNGNTDLLARSFFMPAWEFCAFSRLKNHPPDGQKQQWPFCWSEDCVSNWEIGFVIGSGTEVLFRCGIRRNENILHKFHEEKVFINGNLRGIWNFVRD